MSITTPMALAEDPPVAEIVALLTTDPADLMARTLHASGCSWLRDPPDGPLRCAVQIRYRAPAVPAVVTPGDDGTVRVDFDRPIRAVTPGQAAVFYDGDTVLGGGWIDRVG